MHLAALQKKLLSFARSDLRLAKREGQISIVDTKRGGIDLSYEGGEWYAVVQGRVDRGVLYQPEVLWHTAKEREAAALLSRLYDVRVEG